MRPFGASHSLRIWPSMCRMDPIVGAGEIRRPLQGEGCAAHRQLLRHDRQHRRKHGPAGRIAQGAGAGRKHHPGLYDRQRRHGGVPIFNAGVRGNKTAFYERRAPGALLCPLAGQRIAATRAMLPSWRSAKTCCPRLLTCAGCASPRRGTVRRRSAVVSAATIRSPNWPIGSSWCSTVFTRSTSAPPNGTVPRDVEQVAIGPGQGTTKTWWIWRGRASG